MSKPKPLPCPFCGSDPHVDLPHYIYCRNPECSVRPSMSHTEPWRVLPGWNTRHTPEDAAAPKADAPSEDHKEAYLKSKGWAPYQSDSYRHPSICGTYTRSAAYNVQKKRDAALDTDVDEQLEKDLVDIRWASENECGRIGSMARTILHLLKR